MAEPHKPLIGCATYRYNVGQGLKAFEMIGLSEAYITAVIQAGGIPVLIPMNLNKTAALTILQQVDGFLLPGGGDINPQQYGVTVPHATVSDIDDQRDGLEFELIRTAVTQAIPFLAICRGHQVLNVALGGSLWQDIASEVPDAVSHDNYGRLPRQQLIHPIHITQPDSLLAQQLQTDSLMVNSLHHQAIRDLADGLVATAVAPDGIIEAVELPQHPYGVAVQWHPEHLVQNDVAMRRLFAGLIEAAQA